MNVTVAKTAGFCFGVDRAVSTVYKLLEEGKQAATLGPIIHNPQVTGDLAARGVVTVSRPQETPPGYTLVIRSHGVAQAVEEEIQALGLPYVDAAAAYDEKAGALTLFAINRDPAGDTQIQLDVSAFEDYRFVEHLELCAPDMDARNTWEAPDTIAPAVGQSAKEEQGVVTATLKPLSWNVLRFEK